MGFNGVPGFDEFRIVVAGSGFFGSVIAQCVADELNIPVLLLDRRAHYGGNSWSEIDPETSIEYHRYGSHLFHTSNARVWKYINRFSEFSNYRHRVFTFHQGRMYTMPINLMTINNFFGKSLHAWRGEALHRGRDQRGRHFDAAKSGRKGSQPDRTAPL